MGEIRESAYGKVRRFAEKYGMFAGDGQIVAGVSGGPDSVCMLHMLIRIAGNKRITAVHIHHGIRGPEADEDQAYVEALCRQWQVECQVYHYQVEELAKKNHLSTEEAGRNVRYDTFRRVAAEKGGGCIAVAHNSNDSGETFLLNLFRGTGISGLTGIPPVRDGIVRPLLILDRREIMEYLEKNGIDYRIDHTNNETLYARNKIRNRILPIALDINSQALAHIETAAGMLGEIQDYLRMQAESAYEDCVRENGDFFAFHGEKMQKLPKVIRTMVYRMGLERFSGSLKDIGYEHVEAMNGIAAGQTGKHILLPGGYRWEKEYDRLILRKEIEKPGENGGFCVEWCLREGQTEKLQLPGNRGYFQARIRENTLRIDKIPEKMYTKYLNYDILGEIFQIRTRKAGDYLVINSAGSRKNLGDYMIDQKIPLRERNQKILLAKGDEVFWVVGHRISERMKVSENTKKILEITYFPEEVSFWTTEGKQEMQDFMLH